MSFAWPWLFLLLPLPWGLRRLARPVDAAAALRVPDLADLAGDAASAPSAALSWAAALVWLLLLTAAARPQVPGELVPVSGRDLLLAFDVSASMGTQDMARNRRHIDRLGAARTVAEAFVERRQGDRVGLIVFGSRAYLHTPLTFDLTAVGAALGTAGLGLARPQTALGDAVALATKHLRELPGSARVLVLITDGANTAGELPPTRAAWLAQREGVRIYAVGVGGEPPRSAPRAPSDLDEGTLRDIAAQTGGRYVRATDAAGLEAFFRLVEQLEPAATPAALLRPPRELYPWPLALALALMVWTLAQRMRTARSGGRR